MAKNHPIRNWLAPRSKGAGALRVGLIGYGAFGRLVARHLRPWFSIIVYDPVFTQVEGGGVEIGDMATTAGCEIVIIATPVDGLALVLAEARPHFIPGSLILDVGSVKVLPAKLMLEMIPEGLNIIATHPLFGPESARDGIAGMKIAICPLKGRAGGALRRFLKRNLGLQVIVTTPEAHDREVATSQALVHLIAKVLVQMEPLPNQMTTASFDLLLRSIEMVRHDAPSVFSAIEHSNPFASEVRARFFKLAQDLSNSLEASK